MTVALSRRRLLACAALAVFPTPASGAVRDSLPEGGKGVIGAVHDGDTIRVKEGDADVRLVGIQAPKLPQGRRNPKAWPMADESRGALRALLENHSITLRLGTTPRDRNGRILAHLVRDDGLWIQQT